MRSPRIGLGVGIAATTLAAALSACSSTSDATGPASPGTAVSAATTGNGFPSGSHYNLNIIGVDNPKSANMTGGSGGRIFVSLSGRTNIQLQEGPTFDVLDANGTDGSARFQLPSPDPLNTGTTTYSVYARALGKPGGDATVHTCATDPLSGEVVCSTYGKLEVRSTGKSSATNVTKELLYIYTDVVTGTMTRYPIFDAALQGYFWEYDNNGLKLLQLRFYEQGYTVPAA